MLFPISKSYLKPTWQNGCMLFSAISIGCIHFSPALCSISLGAAFFSGLGLIVFEKESLKPIPLFILGLMLVVAFQAVANLLFHQDGEVWGNKLLVKLPLLLSPLLLRVRWQPQSILGWLLLIALPLSWISSASVLNYLQHLDFYNQMVLESKPIPIYSQVYHIEFSLILGVFSMLSLLAVYRYRQLAGTSWFWLLLVCALLNTINLHILTARTGIVAFWTGLAAGILILRPWQRITTWKMVVTAIVLVGLVFSVPSLRNRLLNSAEDLRAVSGGKDLNNKSFGRRWLAWDAAVTAIRDKPLFGFGMQHVGDAMAWSYGQKKHTLNQHNRILPHNQYLDISLQSGVFAGILLLLVLVTGVNSAFRANNVFLLAFLLAFFLACMFESLLERQAGVLLLAVLMPVLAQWPGNLKD